MKLPIQCNPAHRNNIQSLLSQGISPAQLSNFVAACPRGTVRVMFQMPIYDDQGLFVVGYRPVPLCIPPEDLVPVG